MPAYTQRFDYPPTVELLRSFLTPKAVLSEEKAFKKAWRIYMYLRTIYGDGISLGHGKYINSPLIEEDTSYEFSFFEWLSDLEICLQSQVPHSYKFKINKELGKPTEKFKKRDSALVNLDLLVQITSEDLWFHLLDSQDKREKWSVDFQYHYKVTEQKINELLKLHPFDSQGSDFTNRTRPYRLDFQISLAKAQETHWLQPVYKYNQNGDLVSTGSYLKVESWFKLIPHLSQQDDSQEYTSEVNAEYIPNEELADFITRFAKNSNKRLLFAAEFIMSARLERQKYNKIINSLELNWSNPDDIKPLKLTYKKFKTSPPIINIVYPVIFYYIKRGPYLYAIHPTELEGERYHWYGYRLDRILDVEILDWNNEQIPEKLLELKDEEELPTPEEVEFSLDTDTLGYAFWKPQKMMFVRFERIHYIKYIQDTSRQEVFQEINIENFHEIDGLEQFFNEKEIHLILKSLQKQMNENYVFCIAKFYEEDIDVFLRILTWGKNVKVILPIELKEKIFHEIESTLKVYQEN
ncbi:TIGR03985 family CRISPR-associated protein [Scytonema sp. NUACC26]|uniref:TIGR03985 family CRISPR-associated protein n=1 Tax=Scytonema sp. NUACC26 TaxID=3140176 RepID=UPI0034DBE2E8